MLRSHWPGDVTWSNELQRGDYVIYEYKPGPVMIRKDVLERRGDRLVIEVVMTRGEERRHWIEIGALHAQLKPARVDELLDGATRARLPATELDRLYDWIAPMPAIAEKPYEHGVFHEGWRLTCERSFGDVEWNGDQVKAATVMCPEFPWKLWDHGVWTGDTTFTDLEVRETGRGGYAQVTCPDGTTRTRTKDYDKLEESCARADGSRHGPWSKRDGHGSEHELGRYEGGAKTGLFTRRTFGGGIEQCLFAAGREAGRTIPLHWTHLRFGAAIGAGVLVDRDEGAATVLAQIGWDVWSPKQHCIEPPIRKQVVASSLAAIADAHVLALDDETLTLVRLGLQGYTVQGDFLKTAIFASAGPIVSPRLGIGTSLGIELLFFRLEARYDYVGDHIVSFNVGASDSLVGSLRALLD